MPFNAILVSGKNIQVDESSMTGETLKVDKNELTDDSNESNCFLISNTSIIQGSGEAVVCSFEINIQSESSEAINELTSSYEEKLGNFLKRVSHIGLISAIIIIISMMVFQVIRKLTGSISYSLFGVTSISILIEHITITITVLAIILSGNFSLEITSSLAYCIKTLLYKNILVKRIESCNKMGYINNICADKTGVLVKNHMKVVKIYADNTTFSENLEQTPLSTISNEFLWKGVVFCNNASITYNQEKKRIMEGSSTDCALLLLAENKNENFMIIRKKYAEKYCFNFNTQTKHMITIRETDQKGTLIVYVKGAPNIVLEFCDKYVNEEGKITDLSESKKAEIEENIIAKWNMRAISIAYTEIIESDYNGISFDSCLDKFREGLTLIGIMGLDNPLGPDVKDSITSFHEAGIIVRMITGDNKDVAVNVGKQCGILENRDIEDNTFEVMSGAELRNSLNIESLGVEEMVGQFNKCSAWKK